MIGDIETAIVERLKTAELGYKMQVAPFKANSDEDIEIVLKNSRASALVVFESENKTDDDYGMARTEVTFGILLFARNVRNERASRLGGNGAVGVYQMIEDVKALLHDNDLGLGIAPLKHLRSSPLGTSNVKGFNQSAWLVEFSTAYSFLPFDSQKHQTLSDFLKLHAAWDLPEIDTTTTTNIRGATNDHV